MLRSPFLASFLLRRSDAKSSSYVVRLCGGRVVGRIGTTRGRYARLAAQAGNRPKEEGGRNRPGKDEGDGTASNASVRHQQPGKSFAAPADRAAGRRHENPVDPAQEPAREP